MKYEKTIKKIIFTLFFIINIYFLPIIIINNLPLYAVQSAQLVYKNTQVNPAKIIDTTSVNKIIKIWENNSGILNVIANLEDGKKSIKINVYNMLGKEVKKIFSGIPVNKNSNGEYYFSSETALELPRGVYILVIQGAEFRIAEKFILTKT